MRRCIACRESKPQDELIRFTCCGNKLAADSGKRENGRGIYLCNKAECIENALKRKAFNRVCKCNVDEIEIRKLIEQSLESHQGGIDVKES